MSEPGKRGLKGALRNATKSAAERAQESKQAPLVLPDRAGVQTRSRAATSDHYEVTVNKGSIWLGRFNRVANQRWRDGWQIAHIFEQRGNTVVVWERRAAG